MTSCNHVDADLLNWAAQVSTQFKHTVKGYFLIDLNILSFVYVHFKTLNVSLERVVPLQCTEGYLYIKAIEWMIIISYASFKLCRTALNCHFQLLFLSFIAAKDSFHWALSQYFNEEIHFGWDSFEIAVCRAWSRYCKSNRLTLFFLMRCWCRL